MSQRSKGTSQPESQAQAQAVEKIVSAARRLFAERGPAAVPLREIAAEAGVNYGLIYQYVGTKDDLLRLVFHAASQEYADEFSRANSAREAAEFMMQDRGSDFARMLARVLLEGRDYAVLLDRSPAMIELSRRLGEDLPEAEALSSRDPRVIAATLTTLSMGWSLFGGFVRAITGLTEATDDEVRSLMYAIALAGVDLVDGPAVEETAAT